MDVSEFSNEFVAKMLREIVAVYEVNGEDHFRIQAYQNAAASVEHATEEVRDLWEAGRLKDLSGIGSSIASHLDEYFRTGKVKHFAEVKKGMPPAMFPLLGIPGIGAKTAYILSKRLKLRSKTAVLDLLKSAQSGRIRLLPGFGETSEKSILENLQKVKKSENRMVLPKAVELSERILKYLRENPKVLRAEALGSLRRRAATVGDIDIAVATEHPGEVVRYFAKFSEATEVLNEGNIKGRIILKNGRQVDLMTQRPLAFGALLQHFTGSKNHNIHLREVAKDKGLSLSEYGIKASSGKLEEVASEEQFYAKLGMNYIEPELREDCGEIELALKHNLPTLIKPSDIKGDLQMHTVWSDGQNTLEQMVKSAITIGYAYIGVTDHQMSIEVRGKEWVKAEIRRRRNIIEQINNSNKKIRVLNGIEILIKTSGELAYPDDLLEEFDYVIAAVHTGFNQERAPVTRRIVEALRNPHVSILAHPTGRLLGKREGIDADWEEIFKVCVEEKKFLEIDALPDRLDLPDVLVRRARDLGVKFCIDSDAHATEHLKLMGFGVDVARRGWLSKAEVINTLPFDKLKEALKIETH